ncbi:hypothetical protein MSG28_004049 [Choristoneura fumiferana]|uniref:Uncharacterized protein n=1 Tax=Choristoneura fumiferana TaxID=7141 RepID=A0ACC0KHT7_CHOFU|nr:hypothetical protein MSG28_004049 [Choristoneura fumiferana]
MFLSEVMLLFQDKSNVPPFSPFTSYFLLNERAEHNFANATPNVACITLDVELLKPSESRQKSPSAWPAKAGPSFLSGGF